MIQFFNIKMTELYMKLLVLGDIGVGKTSLVRRYVDDKYSPDYRITVDLDHKVKQVSLEDKTLNLQMWDVPGHERFGNMTSVYYKYSHGAVLVFDLSRQETFDSAVVWKDDFVSKMELETDETLPLVLLGNKCDLPNLSVDRQMYNNYVSENNLLAFYETSARDNKDVSVAVKVLAEHILNTDPYFQQNIKS